MNAITSLNSDLGQKLAKLKLAQLQDLAFTLGIVVEGRQSKAAYIVDLVDFSQRRPRVWKRFYKAA